MANPEHLAILGSGVWEWNRWRKENPTLRPDLTKADVSSLVANKGRTKKDTANLRSCDFSEILCWNGNFEGADLQNSNCQGASAGEANFSFANLKRVNLSGAHCSGASFFSACLEAANLAETDLSKADLSWANLEGANLSGADLTETKLRETNFQNADLSFASLERATLIDTNLRHADLEGCLVFGTSVWGVDLKGARQINLRINENQGDAAMTVDGLEAAQFLYLLTHNPNIRDAIDTIGKKVVLILGRFTPERKVILDGIRTKLRSKNYIPLLFDFECPSSKDLTETITLLARLSRFIIADLTEPKSVPQELQAIIPHLPSIPLLPIIKESEREYGMFEHFKRYPWVLEIFRYRNQKHLMSSMVKSVIGPAEAAIIGSAPKK